MRHHRIYLHMKILECDGSFLILYFVADIKLTLLFFIKEENNNASLMVCICQIK
jgi:hypothetical protein